MPLLIGINCDTFVICPVVLKAAGFTLLFFDGSKLPTTVIASVLVIIYELYSNQYVKKRLW